MKRKLTKLLITLLIVALLLGYAYWWAFYDIQRLKGVEVLQEVPSPNDSRVVTAYLTNGGATTDFGVLCSVKSSGSCKEKNIYWQYHCHSAEVLWLDEQTVRINGVELNVFHDTYDYRHDAE